MKNPFRNIVMLFKRHFLGGVVTLDGVKIDTKLIQSSTVRNLLFKGIYEDDERKLLSVICDERDVILEIGAGIGAIGLIAAKLCNKGAVYSYEANTKMAPVIARNYELNSHVPTLHLKPITTDGLPINFSVSDNIISSSSYSRSDVDGLMNTLESLSITEAMETHAPNFVIMDVEGYEADLLLIPFGKEVTKLLIEFHPHIIGSDTVADLKTRLDEQGFHEMAASGNNVAFLRSV